MCLLSSSILTLVLKFKENKQFKVCSLQPDSVFSKDRLLPLLIQDPLQNYAIMMTHEGHNGYFQIQRFLPKLVLRLETMCKTLGQDNTEIFNCVREKLLSYMREKLSSCVREKLSSYVRKKLLSCVRGETFKLCVKTFLLANFTIFRYLSIILYYH